jgi:ribosomal protein L4
VANAEEENVVKSFRNLDRALVVDPSEVEVAALVWARALVVTEAALELLQRRAS